MPNDENLLWGSAPNLYILTRLGQKLLAKLDVEVAGKVGCYGPKNSLFLGHHLAVRDVYVWLETTARRYEGHRLECWRDDASATFDPDRKQRPRLAEPDAWFTYRLERKVLVGLVECDRGTERGATRWKEKIAGYEVLFNSGSLKTVTGYQNARVVVTTPDARRRDALADLITRHASAELASRFWLAPTDVLGGGDLIAPVWRQAGSTVLRPLVSAELARPRKETAYGSH
jgi:hypothetical protein